MNSFQPREIWPPGTVVDRKYVVQSTLGRGGFGTVYLVHHRVLGHEYVIKRLHSQFAEDPEFIDRFVKEAQAIARLRGCPQIVEVFDMTQTEDGQLILVMEHMPGGDLANQMEKQGTLSVPDTIWYALQIAQALRAAHAAGFVHRDVKPQNVLLGADPKIAKLTDFGIVTDRGSARKTSVMRTGSEGFAAPEQWQFGGKHLDGRADLYALGATMYLMLAGRLPYGDLELREWAYAIQTGPPPALGTVRASMPEDLDRLVLQLLEVDRDKRPGDVSEVIERLMQCSAPKPQAHSETFTQPPTLRTPTLLQAVSLHQPPSQNRIPPSTQIPPPTLHQPLPLQHQPRRTKTIAEAYPTARPVPAPAPESGSAKRDSRRWVVVGLLFLGMVISYVDRGNLSIAASPIMSNFGISPRTMGMLMSAFFWTYGLFQIPAGTLIDRVGVRWVYAAAFVVWSLASAGMALSNGATDIFALRLLLGLAEAAGPIASMTYIRQNFAGPAQGLPTAIYIAGQNLGPAAGSWIGTHVMHLMGWRFMFAATSLAALLWLPLWLWMAPRTKAAKVEPAEAGAAVTPAIISMAGFLAMSGCILFSSYFWYFLLTWVPTYLTSTRHFSTTEMGSIFAIPFVVMAIVNTVTGAFADRLAARIGVFRVRVMFAAFGYTLASIVLLLLVYPESGAALPLLIIAVTGFGIGSANFWSLAQHIPPASMVGRGVGYLNTLSQVAGLLAPLITGYLIGPEHNFTVGFAIAGVCPVLAAVCLLLSGPEGLAAVKRQLAPAAA